MLLDRKQALGIIYHHLARRGDVIRPPTRSVFVVTFNVRVWPRRGGGLTGNGGGKVGRLLG